MANESKEIFPDFKKNFFAARVRVQNKSKNSIFGSKSEDIIAKELLGYTLYTRDNNELGVYKNNKNSDAQKTIKDSKVYTEYIWVINGEKNVSVPWGIPKSDNDGRGVNGVVTFKINLEKIIANDTFYWEKGVSCDIQFEYLTDHFVDVSSRHGGIIVELRDYILRNLGSTLNSLINGYDKSRIKEEIKKICSAPALKDFGIVYDGVVVNLTTEEI